MSIFNLGLVKKSLASLLVVGVAGAVVSFGSGSFADFNAVTSNPGNVVTNGTVSMTNVAGTAVSGTNCTTETYAGTCATLFNTGNTNLKPGAADTTNTVTITYKGTLNSSKFGLYATNYNKSSGSSALCTAVTPSSKLDLQIKQGSTIIYPTSGTGYGTLDDFATSYTSSSDMLALKGGAAGAGSANVWAANDSSVFTINTHLDSSADNTYQGCRSLADLQWYAAQ